MRKTLSFVVAFATTMTFACQEGPTGSTGIIDDVITVDHEGFPVGSAPVAFVGREIQLASDGGVVLPAAYATKMGQRENTFPHAFPPMRYQQVFLGSEIGGKQVFRELCLRLDETFGGPAQTQQIILKLGHTDLDHTTIGTGFDANYSAAPTTVFSGDLDLPAHAGGGDVNSFDICMPFSKPFNYKGGNLIVEIVNTSASFIAAHFEDFCFDAADCTTTRVYAFDAGAATATSRFENQGLVMKLAGAGNPVVESVTGSGSFVVTSQQNDWRTFAFTARRYADGRVAGQWERIRRPDGNAADSKSHGIVTCFTIDGDQAFIGGQATSGLLSEPPDNETAWRVVDNGEGKNAPPDEMSLEFVGGEPGFAADYCATTPEDPALFDLEAGNIQIKQ